MTNRASEAAQPGPSARAHQAVRAALPAYATLIALGRPPQATHPNVAAHLEGCAACRAALDELLALTIPAYTGQVDAAPAYPRADLSFLPPRGEEPV